MQEGFEFGWEAPWTNDDFSDQNDDHSGEMSGANIWPSNLPYFREQALAY